MATIVESKLIKDVYHVHLKVFSDPRGQFVETYRREWFPAGREMVQGNRSASEANVLRGMHFHFNQSDYWYVFQGRIFVALFDAREGSASFGQRECFELGSDASLPTDRGVYIPPGVAHGFQAITKCTLTYLVESYYDPSDELGIIWDDPDMGIPWPNRSPLLSDRDAKNVSFKALPPQSMPHY